MPVTIGTLTSNVNMADAGGAISDEVKEQIIKLAVARMKEELRSEMESQQQGEIRNRRSESD